MKRILSLILACMMIILAASGCAQKKSETGPIAVVVPAADHGWMAAVAYFAQQQCKELGLESGTGYKIVTSANVNEQANQIEEMINLNCSAIVLLPHTDEVSVAAQKIVDANIPLVVFDRKVAGDYSAYIAGDNPGIGTYSADYLGKELSGKGTVAVLNVPSAGSVSTERVNAFKDAIKEKYPEIELVDFTADDFTQQSGLKCATDMLVSNSKIDAIYSIDDESSLGILQAINDANRTDVKYLSGSGGSQTYFNKISETDSINLFTATYSPSMIKEAVKAAKDLADGKSVTKDTIIPPTIATKENVSGLLDANSPY